MAIDAVWVGFPNSYTKGRTRPVQVVCWHYTAGVEGNTAAEAGAHYDKERTDGTSTHYFTDAEGLPLWEVPLGSRAHTARHHGNEIGVHIETCGTRQNRSQWLDPVSTRTLRTTAKLTAQLCIELGLPVRRLSVEECRAAYYAPEGQRPKGIVDHATITLAFPEDHGDHMDLGPEFPWDVVLQWTQEYYNAELGQEETAMMLIYFQDDEWLSDGVRRRKVSDSAKVREVLRTAGAKEVRLNVADVPAGWTPEQYLNAVAGPIAADVPADLTARLDAILAAASNDGQVVLPPEAMTELAEIKAAVDALPDAAETADAVLDEQAQRLAE